MVDVRHTLHYFPSIGWLRPILSGPEHLYTGCVRLDVPNVAPTIDRCPVKFTSVEIVTSIYNKT